MLPKPDKSKKSAAEQLDLVNTISDADKLHRKRRLLIILLISTIGLSFVFTAYRYFKNTFSAKTFPKINLNFSLPAPRLTPDLDKAIGQVLKNNQDTWSIFVESGDFFWSKNFNQSLESQNLKTQKEKLINSPPVSDSPIKSRLPQGVTLQQITDQSKLYALLSVPQKQIFIVIFYSGSDPLSSGLIPSLIETIYWSVIQPN